MQQAEQPNGQQLPQPSEPQVEQSSQVNGQQPNMEVVKVESTPEVHDSGDDSDSESDDEEDEEEQVRLQCIKLWAIESYKS